ncbi:MAG: hypothetical protein A3D28_04465, partial [Omnitrophica bacterium RIFCSPHIGHO2_02_FULL_63_14]
MKVLHCIASLEPSYGGPVKVVQGLCTGLMKLGISVSVLTSSTGDAEKDARLAASWPGVEILWTRPLVRRYYWNPLLPLTLKRRLAGFNLLHVHGVFNGLVSAACRAGRSARIPYVLEPFGTLSPYCLKKSAWLKQIALAAGERRSIEGAASVCFTSEAEQYKALEKFKIIDSFVAPNGVFMDEFEGLRPSGHYRASIGLGPEDGILLFIGRLQPIKGLEVFLPAFIRWQASQPRKWRAVLVGPDEGGYRSKLEALVGRLGGEVCVDFAGPLYGSDRLSLLAESDVVFLTSYHENFGIAAAEGMACGKPILVSETMDIAGTVRSQAMGEVAPLTVEGIVAALERLAGRRGEWDAMGRRGKEWARANCDWTRPAGITAEKYRKILV